MSKAVRRENILRVHTCKLSSDGTFVKPVDEFSELTLHNIITSCEEYADEPIPDKVPQQPESVLPYHNLYLCFYAVTFASELMKQNAICYAVTRDEKSGSRAKKWLKAVLRWDETLYTMYASARLLHAITATVQFIESLLTDKDLVDVYNCINRICLLHEDEMRKTLSEKGTGGHPNLYTAGFGLGALALKKMDFQEKAAKWLDMVIGKYRLDLLSDDSAPDGTYQPDGNWSIEYAYRYKFFFLDALKENTGIDLFSEYSDKAVNITRYLRHAYIGGRNVPVKARYNSNENMLDTYQLNAFCGLYLRLATQLRDPYLQWIATRNPVPGRINAYGNKVIGGHRFINACGITDYSWYDPSLTAVFSPTDEKSIVFPDGQLVVMRSSFDRGVTVSYQGRNCGEMYASPDLMINIDGKPLFCPAPEENSLPMAEANGPFAGSGEMDRKGSITRLEQMPGFDRLYIDGLRTSQEITVDEAGTVNILLRKRPRNTEECELISEEGGYVKLRGEGYLQYEREGNFNPDEGLITMRFRLAKTPAYDPFKPSILFSVGPQLHYMFSDALYIGVIDDGRLGVRLKGPELKWLCSDMSSVCPGFSPQVWHTLSVYWSGLNDPVKIPRCGLVLNGFRNEASLKMPKGSSISFLPKTSLWIGSGVSMPDSFAQADIAWVKIYGKCPQNTLDLSEDEDNLLFHADYSKSLDAVFSKGNGREIVNDGFGYRLHIERNADKNVEIKNGHVEIKCKDQTTYIKPGAAEALFKIEEMPQLRTGFAGKSFEDEEEAPMYQRIQMLPKNSNTDLQFSIESRFQ